MADPLFDPAGMATGPRYTGQRQPRIRDPRYAVDVQRMRRVGYSDSQIEATLQALGPEPSTSKSPPSPVAVSPAATTPVEPAPLPAGSPPLGPQPGTRGEFTGGLGGFDHLRRVQQGYPMPAVDPSMVPPAPATTPAAPALPPGMDPTGMAMGPLETGAGPMPLPAPPAPKPAVPPEVMAAFAGAGGDAPMPATGGGAGGAPMATPPLPGANPFHGGADPLAMGPPRRPAIGPNAPGAGAPADPAAATAEGGGFDFNGIGRNLLEFGLATMAASDQPGASFGGAVGRGGLTAMRAQTERDRYDKAEARADRAEKRADKGLSLQEKRQKADEAYRDASIKLQQAKLAEDPISTVTTRADGGLVAITRNGNRIDLGMKGYTKPTYSATDAVDVARKLATVKVADGFGGETEVFDPTIYNATIKGLGYESLAVGGGGGIDAQAEAIRQQFRSGQIDRAEAERRLQELGVQ